jgi:hypothetical protein
MKIIKTVVISSVIAAAIFGAQAFGQDSVTLTPTASATHDATSEPSLFHHTYSSGALNTPLLSRLAPKYPGSNNIN